jgi:hypothetical protein
MAIIGIQLENDDIIYKFYNKYYSDCVYHCNSIKKSIERKSSSDIITLYNFKELINKGSLHDKLHELFAIHKSLVGTELMMVILKNGTIVVKKSYTDPSKKIRLLTMVRLNKITGRNYMITGHYIFL